MFEALVEVVNAAFRLVTAVFIIGLLYHLTKLVVLVEQEIRIWGLGC